MPHETSFKGVSYQAEMPVSWQAGPPPSATVLQEWMHTNVVVLHALASMESQPPEYEKEFGNDMERRLERVEVKLDLALDLLSRLLAQHSPKPDSCPVTLSASLIEWISHGTAAAGNIVISLFINPRLPQALLLPASVRESTAVPGGTRIAAEFTHLSEEVQEWLERTVFRNHRRFIQSRHRE
jgi:hypothetical protein